MLVLNILKDPLEQFEIIDLFSKFHTNFFYMLWAHGCILYFIFVNYKLLSRNNWTVLIQKTLNFVKNTLKTNLHLNAYPHFMYIYYLFIFILLCNLSGMVAYSFTITSALIVTFFLSSNFFIGANIYGFLLNSSNYFNLFIPKGVPKVILPILFLIEVVSNISRVVSLAVRLFANMMSGHALLKILLSFVWTILNINTGLCACAVFPWIITIMVSLLEYVIAFLQAYVFLVLVIIYLTDVINLH